MQIFYKKDCARLRIWKKSCNFARNFCVAKTFRISEKARIGIPRYRYTGIPKEKLIKSNKQKILIYLCKQSN